MTKHITQEGWQPIATAPKDGTEVLLYAPAGEHNGKPYDARLTFGHWLAPSDVPSLRYCDGYAPEEVWEEFDAHWTSWDGGFSEEHPPTHWHALPPPPTQEGGGMNENAEGVAVVDPTDPGHDVEVLREQVRHLERRIRDLHRERNAGVSRIEDQSPCDHTPMVTGKGGGVEGK